MPKFSIIVPVYNVEEYLDECVRSVIKQSFKDWELLLVDDGSVDKSPEMCDEYSNKDNRIKSFHLKNGGASSARNFGLDNASGEYVIFLDSDDFYNDIDGLKKLNENVCQYNSDICIFGCTDFNMKTNESIVSRTNYDLDLIYKFDINSTLHYLLSTKMIPGGPTIFCAKRDVIENNSIRFKNGIMTEDHDYVLAVFYWAKSISAINDPFYSYRHGRDNSVTSSPNIKTILGIEYTVEKWFEFCKTMDNEQIKKDYLNYIAFMYTTGFVFMGRMDKSTRKKSIKTMKKLRYILSYGYWKKTKFTKFAIKIIGINLFSILSAKYFSLTRVQS